MCKIIQNHLPKSITILQWQIKKEGTQTVHVTWPIQILSANLGGSSSPQRGVEEKLGGNLRKSPYCIALRTGEGWDYLLYGGMITVRPGILITNQYTVHVF